MSDSLSAHSLAQEAAADLTADVFSNGAPETITEEQEQSIGLSADEAATFGWQDQTGVESSLEERLMDPESAPSQVESGAVTEASPGSGPITTSAPAPQLDSNQMFQMQLVQQMQAMQAQQQAFMDSLKPKAPAPTPVDPFDNLPEKYNTPEAKEFLRIAQERILAPYKAEMEGRIAQAQQERLTNQYSNEANQAAQSVLAKGFSFAGDESAVVTDGLRDLALTLSHIHGGTPAQYGESLNKLIDTAVNGRIKHLNSQAKAKVATRVAPGAPRAQSVSAAIPQTPQTEPSLIEVRAAGYRDMEEARWNDFAKVHAKRARSGRG